MWVVFRPFCLMNVMNVKVKLQFYVVNFCPEYAIVLEPFICWSSLRWQTAFNSWHTCDAWLPSITVVLLLLQSFVVGGLVLPLLLLQVDKSPVVAVLTSWFLQSSLGDRAFPVAGARAWNALPPNVTSAPFFCSFQHLFKTFLFQRQLRQ